MACKDCFHARCKLGEVRCRQGNWFGDTYSLRTIMQDRVPKLNKIFKKCRDYSPPDKMEIDLFDKGGLNRVRIARIIEAVRDGRKVWSYDEPTAIKDAYWEKWE